MKILMITDVYFPRINGVSTSIETFRTELITQGHQVTLMAPAYPVTLNDDKDIIRIPSRYLAFDKEDRMLKPRCALKLLEQLKQGSYDIIHIQTPFIAHYLGIKFSMLLNIPLIETYHTYFEEYLFHYLPLIPKSALRYLARKFTLIQCNSVDHVIVPSQAMKEKLREYTVTSAMTILPTGLTPDRFKQGSPDSFIDTLNIDKSRPRLLHVGRIAHEKNIAFLIDVLHQVKITLPDVLMIIAGEGPALKHIKTYVNKHGLTDNVKFVGYLDRNTTLLDCYQSAIAFLFSSRTETQGLVLLEAMAAGTPVVSTAIMGTRDILAPQKGALVAEDNIDHFSSQVIAILSDQNLHQRLAAEAREYAMQWSATAMASQQLALYQEVINLSSSHKTSNAVIEIQSSTHESQHNKT